MHYEINVALHGIHFFATADRSITDEDKARVVYHELNRRLPESAGYSISITKYEHVGKHIDPITFD